MAWHPIRKTLSDWPVSPNMGNYERARSEFSWEKARGELEGLPGGRGLNIAHEAIDRHAAGPCRNHVAIRWLAKDDTVEQFSYARLRGLTNRFARRCRRQRCTSASPFPCGAAGWWRRRFTTRTGRHLTS